VLAGRTLLPLLVDFAEEGLVKLELLFIHLALCLFTLLLVNLLLKELRILIIDLLDLLIQPFLLLLIVRLVARPNNRLLIVVVLSVALTAKLFSNLLG
jgi:hypothetical protein